MEINLKTSVTSAMATLLAHEVAYLTTYETITIEVIEKSTIFESTDRDRAIGYKPINWQVHTTGETFRVSPDWRRGEFAAAERYHALRAGQIYRVEVAGWSLPFINWHRNIIRIDD